MRARNYCAHRNTRDHWTLRCMNRCPDLVVCLKRDLQCLRPETLNVLFRCGVFSTYLRTSSQKSSSLRSPSEVSLRSSWLSRVRSGSSRIRRKVHSTGSSSGEPPQHPFAESHV
ncbi:hypothetical protein TNCV_2566411 [Trichonephila clavipes]|uniref:Uncharacterized protein n=1 Tax=Trichonephila clavipes TaxID=2585209 RepID=A0A8X7BML8_TRICX|nr:hypothetical protein TNCV_2566411 [Trichonephila clavipes]